MLEWEQSVDKGISAPLKKKLVNMVQAEKPQETAEEVDAVLMVASQKDIMFAVNKNRKQQNAVRL
jgi:predicted ATP-grasp superfamily ATP-dependent carboligase